MGQVITRKGKSKYGHGSAHALQVRLACYGVDGDLVDLDTHVCGTFVECSMRSHWDDPG